MKMHESSIFSVWKTETGYYIAKDKGTHSCFVGFEYPLDEDGLKNAIEYCDLRAKRLGENV